MLQPTDTERQDIIKAVFGEALADYANSSRFKAYFNHYCSVVCPASSGDAVIELDTPALKTHADVLSCIEIIVQDPKISFNKFVARAVESKSTEASLREKKYVARVAVEVAFAVNCTLRDYYLDNFIDGGSHYVEWEEHVSFVYFIEKAFKSGSQQIRTPEQQRRGAETMTRKTSLKAWKLTKRCGIKIRPTDNLLEHLALDIETMTLKVFHQVSFLRAHLAKSKHEPLDLSFEDSLRRWGIP